MSIAGREEKKNEYIGKSKTIFNLPSRYSRYSSYDVSWSFLHNVYTFCIFTNHDHHSYTHTYCAQMIILVFFFTLTFHNTRSFQYFFSFFYFQLFYTNNNLILSFLCNFKCENDVELIKINLKIRRNTQKTNYYFRTQILDWNSNLIAAQQRENDNVTQIWELFVSVSHELNVIT